jgi:ketosteroid isomerase-like protein
MDMEAAYRQVVEAYIAAYNAFDIAGMCACLHPDIVFENISHKQLTLRTEGLENFRAQALLAVAYFSERRQKIQYMHVVADRVEVDIQYQATLKVDVPGWLNAGERVELVGKSIFQFQDGKICLLQDIS